MKHLIHAAALSAVIALPLAAGGLKEAPVGGGVYLVYETPVAGDARLFRDRFDMPAAAAALGWSRFRVAAGRLEIDGSGAYSHARLVSEESLAGCVVYGYQLERSASDDRGAERMEVAFSCSDLISTGRQPARYAVEEAIRRSGRASGSVRVAEIEYRGRGRFHVVVLLRS